jgi:hypothetical protein
MLSSTPAFPPFERWQAMSEAEQDALIGRMETARRRRRNLVRLAVGLACAAAAAGVSVTLYLQLAS